MGSSVKSATNATTKAIRDTTRNTVRQAQSVAKVAENIGQGVRKRPLENLVSLATLGAPALVREAGKIGAEAVGLGDEAPVSVADPNASIADQAASVADPQQKRRRQLAGRAGTLLTGGTSGNGTSLGGTGGRSTLLGL